MNAKIITVWGVNGSGKTTTAVNLAMAIAERGFMVGIISSKLYYGELQGLFGKRVEADKGTYCAILKGCNTKNKFAETENPNLFFLSVHNSFDGMLLTAISGETIKELIDDAVIRFDYIIIDGNEELNNPVSSIGLTMADKIINVHRASVKDCIWFSAMSHMIGLLHLAIKYIGMVGAAMSTAISLICQTILLNIYYKKKIGIYIGYLFYQSYKGILPFLIIADAIACIVIAFINNVYCQLFIGGIVFVMIFAGLYIRFGMNEIEKNIFNKVIKKFIKPNKGE